MPVDSRESQRTARSRHRFLYGNFRHRLSMTKIIHFRKKKLCIGS